MSHPAILLARPRAVALLSEDWALSYLADFARPRPRSGLVGRTLRAVGLAGDRDEVPPSREMAAPQIEWAPDPVHCDGFTLAGPVAVVDVKGLLTQEGYYDWWDDCWIGGYAQIGAAIRAARADERVKGILLRFDSPGGLVNGCFELADEVRSGSARAGGKPIWASVMMACSAAYALASACDRIVAPATVYVGSIGVYMLHLDQSKMLELFGLKITEIVNAGGDHKTDFAGWKPLSDAARADAQAIIDETARLFFACVSAGRGLAPDVVKGLEARAFMAQHADAARSGLALKLVDEIGSERSAAEGLAKQVVELPISDPASSPDDAEETDMDNEKLAAILASKDSDADKAKKIQALAGLPPAAAATPPAADALTAERGRAKAILDSAHAEGRGTLARHLAFDTDMTAEAAVALLEKSPKAEAPKGSRLDGKVPQPKVGVVDTGGGPANDFEAGRQAVLARKAGKAAA